MLFERSFIALLLALSLTASPAAAQSQSEPLFKEAAPKTTRSLPEKQQFPNFTDLVKAVSPAVVNISGEGSVSDSADSGPPSDMPPMPRRELGRPARSLGSGFIVNEQGYIVTNNHVIEGADRIVVRLLDDDNEYIASVIGKDQKTDSALLKIEPKSKLTVATLGDSDSVEVGEWVFAIGNQFQLGQTVTAGIVSAKARRVPTFVNGPYDNFIQTDASINPGSSGGPLINTKGQVIGVNTAIFSPGRSSFGGTGFNIGIGFATPINILKSVMTQLRSQGHVTRGLLGVIIQRIDADMATALGLPNAAGALVADIMPNSPAERAAFERKDVIVRYQGHDIKEHDMLPLLVAGTPVGTTVDIEVIRNGERKKLQAKIEELKELPLPEEPEMIKPDRIGTIVQDLSADVARALREADARGVIVTLVHPGSLAERSGLARGDIIKEIDGHAIANKEDYTREIDALPKDKPVLVMIKRREGTRYLTLKRQGAETEGGVAR